MKKHTETSEPTTNVLHPVKNITRKKAIQKAGYAAISAATMLVLLNDPKKAYASSSASPDAPTGWPKKI